MTTKKARTRAQQGCISDLPRFVELIRVSSRLQLELDTAENQRRALDQLAKRRPGRRIERIEALAVSGAIPLHETRQGKQLLDLAAQGFDELRLWDVDRGLGARAEDPADRLALLSLAREAGAVIVDRNEQIVDPGDELGEMSFILRTFFAAQERRKIIARTRAGRERIAADGGYAGGGHLPYGLEWNATERKFEIDEERAAYVRDSFAGVWKEQSATLSLGSSMRVASQPGWAVAGTAIPYGACCETLPISGNGHRSGSPWRYPPSSRSRCGTMSNANWIGASSAGARAKRPGAYL